MGRCKTLCIVAVLASLFLLVVSKPTRRYRYDAEFLDSEIQRIRSGRAEEQDPVWNVKKSNSTSTEKPGSGEDSNATSGEDDEESGSESDPYYDSSEEVEITCAAGKGWHTRGQRCVPVYCPGGPAERDFNTGECLYSYQPKGRYVKPFQQWNDLNHVYRSSPMSTHFVRHMILMRKG